MREYDLQIIILTSYASASAKVAMMSILKKVDWDTWQCTITQKHLREYCKLSESTLKRALKELDKMGWISRHTERRGAKNTPTIIKVNTSALAKINMTLVQNEPNHGVNMTLVQNEPNHGVNMTSPMGQNEPNHEVKMNHITMSNNINTIYNNIDNSKSVVEIEGGKEYYRELYLSIYNIDIEAPVNYDAMSQDRLQAMYDNEPTWLALSSYEGRALHVELTKRASWLAVPLSKSKAFFIAEKKREGV